MDRRAEQRAVAGENLATSQDQRKPNPTRGYQSPEVGDLVRVRDVQLAKEKRKKLETRWSTPRILERISKSGVSGHICQLHDPLDKSKEFNLDNLILSFTLSED